MTYLASSDPGLVRIWNSDDGPHRERSGLVTLRRRFACRPAFLPRARQLLIPGTRLDASSLLYLENPPSEADVDGYKVFACEFMGLDFEEHLRRPPAVFHSTGYAVLTVRRRNRTTTYRVSFPQVSYEWVEARDAVPLVIQPQFRPEAITSQRLASVQREDDGTPQQSIRYKVQETNNTTRELFAFNVRTQSFARQPFVSDGGGGGFAVSISDE